MINMKQKVNMKMITQNDQYDSESKNENEESISYNYSSTQNENGYLFH